MRCNAPLSLVLATWTSAVMADPFARVEVTNPTNEAWAEAPVTCPFPRRPVDPPLPAPAAGQSWQLVIAGENAPLVQVDDLNGDGYPDEFAFLARLAAHETRTYELQYVLDTNHPVTKRAHARMSLKGYDGVGWESDVVAYRIYSNLDNATDIFGKTRPILSLDYWATPGVRHDTESKYGLDVLKVGRGLGIGGFGVWRDGKVHKVTNVMKDYHIRADGPVRAVVDLEYVHWIVGQRDPDAKFEPGTRLDTYDMNVRMSIFAGQKWTQAQLTIAPGKGSRAPEIVVGLPIHEETDLIQDAKIGMVGRWGRQALGDGEVPKAADLGMGVIVEPTQTIDYGSDGINQYARLKPQDGEVAYRIHGSWSKEPDGAHSTKEYEAMLRRVAELKPQVKVQTLP